MVKLARESLPQRRIAIQVEVSFDRLRDDVNRMRARRSANNLPSDRPGSFSQDWGDGELKQTHTSVPFEQAVAKPFEALDANVLFLLDAPYCPGIVTHHKHSLLAACDIEEAP